MLANRGVEFLVECERVEMFHMHRNIRNNLLAMQMVNLFICRFIPLIIYRIGLRHLHFYSL